MSGHYSELYLRIDGALMKMNFYSKHNGTKTQSGNQTQVDIQSATATTAHVSTGAGMTLKKT